jgi:hypothetical protein
MEHTLDREIYVVGSESIRSGGRRLPKTSGSRIDIKEISATRLGQRPVPSVKGRKGIIPMTNEQKELLWVPETPAPLFPKLWPLSPGVGDGSGTTVP